MDMRDPTRSKHNGNSKAGEQDPQVVPVGTLRRFLSKIKAPQQIKQEPEKGIQQCWDTWWQGSLKAVYSPQIGEEEPQNSKVKLEEDGRGFQTSSKAVVDTSGCPTREPVAQTLLGHLRVSQEASEGLDLSLKVKEEVLDEETLSSEARRQRFRHFCYQEAKEPREALRQLQGLCYQWLEPDRRTKEQILELVILEQFLDILPLEMQSWVKEQGPETCAKAVAQAEDFLVRLKEMKEPFQTVIVKSPESGQEPLDAMTRQSDELARLLGHVQVKIKGEDLCSQRPEQLLLNETSLGETKENDLLHSDEGERLLNQAGLETFHRNTSGQVAETALLCLGDSDSSLHESTVNGGILERRRKNVCAECENLGWNFSFTFPKNQKRQREERVNNCGQCGKILKRGASHVTQKQAVSGEKPYQCLECGKSFGWKSSLTSHKRTHMGDKPYRCTECGKSFTISSQLIRHKRIHADLWVTLAAQKKRKIDAECRVFNEKWTLDYFFVEVKCMPVCLICGEALSIMKKANLQRHYRTKHLQYEEYQGQLREEKVKALKNDFDKQQGLSTQPRRDMNSVEQASHMVSELIARKLRRHSEGEIVKECLVATAALLAPEKLKLFESVSFSRKMVPHQIKMAQNVSLCFAKND